MAGLPEANKNLTKEDVRQNILNLISACEYEMKEKLKKGFRGTEESEEEERVKAAAQLAAIFKEAVDNNKVVKNFHFRTLAHRADAITPEEAVQMAATAAVLTADVKSESWFRRQLQGLNVFHLIHLIMMAYALYLGFCKQKDMTVFLPTSIQEYIQPPPPEPEPEPWISTSTTMVGGAAASLVTTVIGIMYGMVPKDEMEQMMIGSTEQSDREAAVEALMSMGGGGGFRAAQNNNGSLRRLMTSAGVPFAMTAVIYALSFLSSEDESTQRLLQSSVQRAVNVVQTMESGVATMQFLQMSAEAALDTMQTSIATMDSMEDLQQKTFFLLQEFMKTVEDEETREELILMRLWPVIALAHVFKIMLGFARRR